MEVFSVPDWVVPAIVASFLTAFTPQIAKRLGWGTISSWIVAVAVFFGSALLIRWALGDAERIAASEIGWVVNGRRPATITEYQVAQGVVRSQKAWQNSKILLDRGESLTISASGAVHIAIKDLVSAIEADSLPRYGWVGPKGEDSVRVDRGKPGREKCLLLPKRPYGALVMAIESDSILSVTRARQLARNDPVAIHTVGNILEQESVPRGGYLHFAVNDVYLNREDCDPAFVNGGGDPEQFLIDNLGSFSVGVQAK